MSAFIEKPTQDFLDKLAAFKPEYSSVRCAKEMVEFLVIMTEAPLLVRNCLDGFFKGNYTHLIYSAEIKELIEGSSNHENQ